ncbi:MAG: mechanosensitive ion channel family protein [Geminicoccaceae bacterium]|nr:mechanosensitive ion channel family protein [Geminicoccaceae bacterium]
MALLAALAMAQARAQPAPGTATGPATTTTAEPSAAELDALLRALEDPAERAILVARLRALREAMAEAPPAPPPAADPLELASRLLVERLDALTRALASLWALLGQLPQLGDWFAYQLDNEFRRALWRNVAVGIAQALGAGALVGWLLGRLLHSRRPRAPRTPLARLGAVAIDLAPATVFALIAGAILDLGAFLPATARVGWLLVAAILVDRVVSVAATHLALALGEPEGTRGPGPLAGTLRALVRIARLVIYGWTTLLVAGRLGLPPDLFDVGTSFLTLLVAGALSAVVLWRRSVLEDGVRALGRWIETDYLRRLLLLELVAGSIHLWLLALIWLNAALLVLGLGYGPARATLASLAILLLAHLVLTWLERPPAAPAGAGEPEEPAEASRPRTPLATRLAKGAVKLATLLLLLEAWGVGLFAWLATVEGRAAAEKALRIALVLLVCWLAWRLASWWIGGVIAARDADGNVLYDNRTRTAAAIARSVIVVVLALIAITTTLTELGVQTAPLLAGAGVVGLAIGFGSQQLVRDIINGLFILLGDTIRVGDVVEVGGKSGVVEAISMRTVTLRSYNGDVHTIPFGTIDRVTNMTRDFSFWVLDVQVSYRENVERVVGVLHELDAQMRREWPWRRLILAPLEIAGVDQLGENGVVIRGRIKTRPGEQWRVGRELNRRIKRRFDELGIEIPFPQRTVHIRTEPAAAATAPEGSVQSEERRSRASARG